MSRHHAPTTFDLTGPLPAGLTVLEASAGTGKTFTIAALAARFVADGLPLERLLLVTFTRMATGELRERVRERLVHTEAALDRAQAGRAPGAGDPVVDLLAAAPAATVRASRDRLARAVADFDAATIATTHQFCQEVLHGLGTIGDLERDVTLVEDALELEDEALADLFVRRFHREVPAFGHDEARAIARAAIANPATPIVPDREGGGDVAAMRGRLARAVRAELQARKRQAGVLTYDDLLTGLRGALAGPDGPEAVRRLRARFDVVLVDEFQDTDPIQWEILRRAFGPGGPQEDRTHRRALVLIGDPKQAIYAFRGADVHAYLDAAGHADDEATLGTNWRSDQGLIDGLDALFDGARLGDPRIVHRPVTAAPGHREGRLRGAPRPAPLRIRMAFREQDGLTLTPTGLAQLASAREHVTRDLAADVARLLSSAATIVRRPDEEEPVRPADVAVLVRTNRQAADVRDELERIGVPAVINGAGSVFLTPPARDWLRLLDALERPSAAGRAHVAALTPFLGWSAARVAGAGEADWEEVHRRLHAWARTLRTRGVAALLETVTHAEGLPARLLGEHDGERRLTDLRHVGQLLHQASSAERLGITALATWLRRRVAEAEREADEERSRRLESDAEAVQVLTIHRSKGLEFGIVYLPFLSEPGWMPEDRPVTFHGDDGVRRLDVGLTGTTFVEHQRRHADEVAGEELRLAYVALTRARHQAVVWWVGTWQAGRSPLGRLLFSRGEGGEVSAEGGRTPGDRPAADRFAALRDAAPDGVVAFERAAVGEQVPFTVPTAPPSTLETARLGRTLDARWRRTSYSALTAGEHVAAVASEPEAPGTTDEPDEPPASAVADLLPAGADDHSPMAGLPGGTGFGTVVHRVLETTDFAAADLDAELGDALAGTLAVRPQEVGDPAALVAALRLAVETPLGPDLGGLRLRDVPADGRIDEMAFELPLAGGDAARGDALVTLAAVGDVLDERLPTGDPFAAYAQRLRAPALARRVRGYLTGSLDLVVRRPDGAFVVVDHKTNRLAPRDEPLLLGHYAPERLREEMRRADYVLQALLYQVALHRYLRWRLPDYRPDRHLGGVAYLFLRGMAGTTTPTAPDGTPHGVVAWAPGAGVVTALSDLLDRGVAA